MTRTRALQIFSHHGFCLKNLANLVTFAERKFVKKRVIEQNMYLFSNSEEFFFEFYYIDEIVTENEGNVEVISVTRFAYLKPYN